jgi:hypothetical protein
MAQKFNKYGADHRNNLPVQMTQVGWFYNNDKVGGFAFSVSKWQDEELFDIMRRLNNKFEENIDELMYDMEGNLSDEDKKMFTDYIESELQDNINNWYELNNLNPNEPLGNHIVITNESIPHLGRICSSIQLLTKMEAIPNDEYNGMSYAYMNSANGILSIN